MIYKYRSVKSLIAKVYRDLQLTEEDKWTSMIEWAAEALQFIGAYYQFQPKTTDLEVVGHKASLPCDFYSLNQISFNKAPLIHGSGSFDTTEECDDCEENKTSSRFEYTINDSYIFTNMDGTICMSYLAIPTDDEGFPLIPDDVTYTEAITRYIVKMLYYKDFLSGIMDAHKYDKLENDWNYKCMQARGKANLPTTDQLESIKNMWVRLIPQMQEHSQFFKNMNYEESIKLGKR